MSNPIRNYERTMAAMAALMLFKFQGELLPLQYLDASPVNLYMMPYSSRDVYGQYQKLSNDATDGKFDIPLQTGFDGTNICSGSTITFDGMAFQVKEVDSDGIGALFTAICTARNARQV